MSNQAKAVAQLAYDLELVTQKLARWQAYMERYTLPAWEQMPDMELYIDQVVMLVERYLDLIPHDERNPVITPSSVNNYVRLKVMPPPVRKRYSRRHLAYVVMICVMKQSMTLTEIQKILPRDMDDAHTKEIYDDFAAKLHTTAQVFIDQVRAVADRELKNADGCTSLVLHSTVSAVLYKLLTVKLTGLRLPEPEQPPEGK